MDNSSTKFFEHVIYKIASGDREKINNLLNDESNYHKLLDYIRNPNSNINFQNKKGFTLLMVFSAYARTPRFESIVEEILQHPKINVNIRDKYGWTALMYACYYSNEVSTERTFQLLNRHMNWVKRKRLIMSRLQSRKAVGLGM
jgi:ankyrin repeat protein